MRMHILRALAALGLASLSGAALAANPNGPLDYFSVYGLADGTSFDEFNTLKGLKAVEAANPANVVTVFPDTDALRVRNVYSGTKSGGNIVGLRPLASIVVKGGVFYRVDLRTASPSAVQLSSQSGLLACSIPRIIPQGHLDSNTLSSSVLIYQGPSGSNPSLCGQFRSVRLDAGPSEVPVALPSLRAGFVSLYKPSGAFIGVLQRTCVSASSCALTFLAGNNLTAPAPVTVVASPVYSFTVMATDEAGNSAVVMKTTSTAKASMLRIDGSGALAGTLRDAPADDYAITDSDGTGHAIAATDGTTLFFTENRITPVASGLSSRIVRVPLDGSAAATVMVRATSQLQVHGTTPDRVIYQLGYFTGNPDFPPFQLLTIPKTAAAGVPAPVQLFQVAANAGYLTTPRLVGSNVYYNTRQGVGENAVDRAWMKNADGTLVKKFGPGSGWRFGGVINHPIPQAQLRAVLQTGLYLYKGGALESAPYDYQFLTRDGTGGRAVGGSLSLHRISDQKNFVLTTLTDSQSMVNSGIVGNYVLDRILDTSGATPSDPLDMDVIGIGTASHTWDRITTTPTTDEGLSY